MSINGTPMGRTDHTAPMLSWRTRANLTLAALAVVVAGAWHLTIVATATGVGIGDLGMTARALRAGHPLAGLAPAHPASPTVTLVVYGVAPAPGHRQRLCRSWSDPGRHGR